MRPGVLFDVLQIDPKCCTLCSGARQPRRGPRIVGEIDPYSLSPADRSVDRVIVAESIGHMTTDPEAPERIFEYLRCIPPGDSLHRIKAVAESAAENPADLVDVEQLGRQL